MTTMEAPAAATRGDPCDHTWVSVDDLAGELQIPKSTIYGWKARGLGPVWKRVGKHLRARRTDVDAWLNGLDEATPKNSDGAEDKLPGHLDAAERVTSHQR